MDAIQWIITGLFLALSLSCVALAAALRAAARLGQLLSAVKELDWDSVADLSHDVQKLKKQVQRYRNEENAQKRSLQTSALHQVADQVMHEKLPNVTNIQRGG